MVFSDWVEIVNIFCLMLVDCIVIGYLCEEVEKLEVEFGYYDVFLDIVEYFWLFVIQGLQGLVEMLWLDCCLLNICIVEDIWFYKVCKVVIFNGVYIVLVLVVWLCGVDMVGEVMWDKVVCYYVQQMIDEEIILVFDLLVEEFCQFVDVVIGCFFNFYICY